jgi:hypothetical protein
MVDVWIRVRPSEMAKLRLPVTVTGIASTAVILGTSLIGARRKWRCASRRLFERTDARCGSPVGPRWMDAIHASARQAGQACTGTALSNAG